MDSDTKTTIASISAVAIVLATIGILFFTTGSKWAAYLGLASPVLVVLGVFLFKRGMVRLGRYSFPVQLKAKNLAAFVEDYNRLAASAHAASLRFGIPPNQIPDLTPVTAELSAFIRRTGDPRRALEVKNKEPDELELAILDRARRNLTPLRKEVEDRVVAAVNERLGPLGALVQEFRKLGLTRVEGLALSAGPDPMAQVETLGGTLHLVASEVGQSLRAHVDILRGLYKDVTAEEAALAQANQVLAAGDYHRALAGFRDVAVRCEDKVREEFQHEHNVLLEAAVTMDEHPGVRLLDEPFQKLAHNIAKAVNDLKSPLQLDRLRALRPTMIETAQKLLKALEGLATDDETANQALLAQYLSGFGTMSASPGPDETLENYIGLWKQRFDLLAAGLRSTRLESAQESLYRRLVPKIQELLRTAGAVTAKDLKLNDAGSIFARYIKDHADAEVQAGRLVPGGTKQKRGPRGRAADA